MLFHIEIFGILTFDFKSDNTPHPHTRTTKDELVHSFKDIVQPEMRGSRVVPVNSPRLHTKSMMFFRYTERATLVISTSTNWLQRLGPKKDGVFLCGVHYQSLKRAL